MGNKREYEKVYSRIIDEPDEQGLDSVWLSPSGKTVMVDSKRFSKGESAHYIIHYRIGVTGVLTHIRTFGYIACERLIRDAGEAVKGRAEHKQKIHKIRYWPWTSAQRMEDDI